MDMQVLTVTSCCKLHHILIHAVNAVHSLDQLREARSCGQAIVPSQAVASQDDRAIIHNLLNEGCDLIRPDGLAVIYQSLVTPSKPEQV